MKNYRTNAIMQVDELRELLGLKEEYIQINPNSFLVTIEVKGKYLRRDPRFEELWKNMYDYRILHKIPLLTIHIYSKSYNIIRHRYHKKLKDMWIGEDDVLEKIKLGIYLDRIDESIDNLIDTLKEKL